MALLRSDLCAIAFTTSREREGTRWDGEGGDLGSVVPATKTEPPEYTYTFTHVMYNTRGSHGICQE